MLVSIFFQHLASIFGCFVLSPVYLFVASRYGTDMSGEGRLRSEWNTVLLQHAIAPTYLQLLQHASNVGGELCALPRGWGRLLRRADSIEC